MKISWIDICAIQINKYYIIIIIIIISVDVTVRKGSCPENVATVVLSQRRVTCTLKE